MYVLSFLISFALAQSPETTIKMENTEPQKKVLGFEYSLDLELAVEASSSKLEGQRQQNQTALQNLAIGSQLKFSDNFSFYAELLGEQNQDNTEVYFGEVFVQYALDFYNNISFNVGNMYYNYGLLVQQEALLSRRPDYYSDLLVTRRGIDLGATLRWQPTQSLPIYLSYSRFSGKTLRPGDQQTQNADIQPHVASLSYEPSFMKVQATYLQRKYVQNPTMTAYGLSAEATPLSLWTHRFQLTPMAEFWDMTYSRVDGLQRNGQAYMVGNKTSLFGFFHRWIFANEKWVNDTGLTSELTQKFQMHGLGYQFNKYLHFEYQNIVSQENQAALNLTPINEDVYRFYFRL